MTSKQRNILSLGKVVSAERDGNEKIVHVALVGEENRSSRTVIVHAMAGDVAAISAALSQRQRENQQLAQLIACGRTEGLR